MAEYTVKLYRSNIDSKAFLNGVFRYNHTPISVIRMKATTLTQFRKDLKKFLSGIPEDSMSAEIIDGDDNIIATVQAVKSPGSEGVGVFWHGKKHGIVLDNGELSSLEKDLYPTITKYTLGFSSDIKGTPSYTGMTIKAESMDDLRMKIIKNTPKFMKDYYADKVQHIYYKVYKGRTQIAVMDVLKGGKDAVWYTSGKDGMNHKAVDPKTGKIGRL